MPPSPFAQAVPPPGRGQSVQYGVSPVELDRSGESRYKGARIQNCPGRGSVLREALEQGGAIWSRTGRCPAP